MDETVRDLVMMRRCIELAREAATHGEVPVGAVVYRGHEVIAEACNRREADEDPTAHAEVIALREAGRKLGHWRLVGCGLAVTLEPCAMCAGALVNARIAEVVYGCADPKFGCVDTLHTLCTEPRFNHRLTVRRGVLADECAGLLRAFFAARRRPASPSDSARPLSLSLDDSHGLSGSGTLPTPRESSPRPSAEDDADDSAAIRPVIVKRTAPLSAYRAQR